MLNVIMLSVTIVYCYAECRYAECRYAERRYAECHNTECFGLFIDLKGVPLWQAPSLLASITLL
jgi:hypothetical protein